MLRPMGHPRNKPSKGVLDHDFVIHQQYENKNSPQSRLTCRHAAFAYVLSEFRLGLLGKFLAFAILAMGLDLIWGYTAFSAWDTAYISDSAPMAWRCI